MSGKIIYLLAFNFVKFIHSTKLSDNNYCNFTAGKYTFMKKLLLLGSVLGFFLNFPTKIYSQCANADSVFISELHYDNVGTDVNEGFEISGPAGTDLTCYQVVLYNGSGGTVYGTINLTGVIDNEGCGYGAVWVGLPTNGMQNGAPDGLALVNTCSNQVVMFISYEGSFLATNGPAAGLTSTDIGVAESNGSTGSNQSLQLSGTGYCYADIVASGGWQPPATNTTDNLNPGLVSLTTCSSGVVDSLDFQEPGCAEPNQNTTFEVCAVDAAGNVVTSYNGTITVSVSSGPGNMTGTLTATASNGCASFTVSFDAVGDYTLSATDGTYSGTSNPITVSNSCPPPCPVLHRHLVNSCVGNEGINEYAVIRNGQSAITVNDIKVTFPNGGSFCNSGCGTQTWVSNTAYVNQLNAAAGCTPDLFVDAIANGGTIPPGATIVVFTGANPTDVLDFTNECGQGPYYAIFANNTDVSGRYVNSRPSCADTRTTTIEIGTCAPADYTYQPCMFSPAKDGDMVVYDTAGNPTYVNDPNCATILPITLQNFSLIKYENKIELFWNIREEVYNLQLLKSQKPTHGFEIIARNLQARDAFSDYALSSNELFYKLRWRNTAGEWLESNTLNVLIAETENIEIFPNPIKDKVFVKGIASPKNMILMNELGKVLFQQNVNSSQEASEILTNTFRNLPGGTYILKIGNSRKLLVKL